MGHSMCYSCKSLHVFAYIGKLYIQYSAQSPKVYTERPARKTFNHFKKVKLICTQGT